MTASIAAGSGVPGDDPDDDLDLAASWRPPPRPAVDPVVRRVRSDGGLVTSAFFGCLVAVGATGLLVAVVAGLASALGLSPGLGDPRAAAAASGPVSLMTHSALLGSILLSYFAGGYAAVRMSGSGGLLLGFVVWAWAQLVGAVVVTFLTLAQSTAGLPAGWLGGLGSGVVDASVGAMGPLTILAVVVTALAGSTFGSTVGRGPWRRAARPGRVRGTRGTGSRPQSYAPDK